MSRYAGKRGADPLPMQRCTLSFVGAIEIKKGFASDVENGDHEQVDRFEGFEEVEIGETRGLAGL